MSNNKISPRELISQLKQRKKLFFKVWAVTFVVSVVYIFPQPRFYTSTILMAPESGSGEIGGLGALASSFGLDIGKADIDAINPLMYPDIMTSNEFAVGLLDIPVKTLDGEVSCDYQSYLVQHQKSAFYDVPFIKFRKWFKSVFSKKSKSDEATDGKINPFNMSESETALVESVIANISCTVDKTTGCFFVKAKAQDPLVAAILADSTCLHLQNYITAYRTSKSRVDMEYYCQLKDSAYADYLEASNRYSRYVDSHQDAIFQYVLKERDRLEMEMESKLTLYQGMNTQYETAKSKVQAKTPVFTVLQGATVPIKPAGPKRMLFVLVMLFLSTVCTSGIVLRKSLTKSFVFMSESEND